MNYFKSCTPSVTFLFCFFFLFSYQSVFAYQTPFNYLTTSATGTNIYLTNSTCDMPGAGHYELDLTTSTTTLVLFNAYPYGFGCFSWPYSFDVSGFAAAQGYTLQPGDIAQVWGDMGNSVLYYYDGSGLSTSSSMATTTSTSTASTTTQSKTPVIIVPGIMGTQFLKNYGDNTEIWPNIDGLLTSFSDSFLNDLSLLPDGSEDSNFPITLGDIMRKTTLAGNTVSDTWQGMIDTLTAGGYTEGIDLFVFPYDWRKSNSDDAVMLQNKIDDVLSQTGASKVDILSHSMGGLIAQEYIALNGADKIDKLFFFGTPHLGAPKAFKALMYGDDMGIKLLLSFLSPSEVKVISQNFPAVFDLLPSQNYVGIDKYIYNATASTSKWLDYNETKSFMIDQGRNSTMFPQAESLHSNIDNFNLSGADIYNFSGCGLTKTIGKITVKKKKSWTSLGQKIVDDYILDYTNGDETVPLISSVGPFGNHNYFVNGVAHSALPSSLGVPDTILSLLSGSSSQIISNISTSSSFCDVTGRVVSTHSPVIMNIYDDAGNHTGPIGTGDIEYGIPGVNFDVIEGDEFAFLPQNGNYKIVIKATDTGAYDFYVTEIGSNDIKIGESYWNEIPLTTLLANFEINISSASTAYIMKVDEDGDGIFESNISPSAILTSSSAGDLIPPQTTNAVSATGKISFTATDDNAGVLKTEYSYDGNTWILYSAPFSASGKTVSYFSTDNVGNIESVQSTIVPATILMVGSHSRSSVNVSMPSSTLSELTGKALPQTGQASTTENQNLGEAVPQSTLLTSSTQQLSTPKPTLSVSKLTTASSKKEISVEIPPVSSTQVQEQERSLTNNELMAAVAGSGMNTAPIAIVVNIASLITLVLIIKKYMISHNL